MTGRVLVAGIGNVFLGDDGFGVEVVRRIDPAALPPGVDVVDYGIRGVHLAYDLLDGAHDTVVLVDAVPLDGPPGTLAVLEVPAPGAGGHAPAGSAAVVDGHGLDPDAVLHLLGDLGGSVARVLVVGCAPADVHPAMHLSPPVAAAVGPAVALVHEVVSGAAARPGEEDGVRG
ncbi:hydrogenase maturation protease [Geodermatophilus ruber]|uniref:Hydrogenase maturation protease n=1 Tax=Geodermatophilus ruber TaxID=504800 RepID=A0A1I4EIS3_9ACTN|nr:hydrogenase maturation protease [Geodermatophilus ruber]SFL05658.1 hydrogenase maturation protease [Geodermatophilus ruber]